MVKLGCARTELFRIESGVGMFGEIDWGQVLMNSGSWLLSAIGSFIGWVVQDPPRVALTLGVPTLAIAIVLAILYRPSRRAKLRQKRRDKEAKREQKRLARQNARMARKRGAAPINDEMAH